MPADTRFPIALASGRIAFGTLMMLTPRLAARMFLGGEVDRPAVRFLARIFGIRDLAVGVMLLQAAQRGEDMTRALWIGVACDVFDAKTAFLSRGGLTKWGRRLVMGAGLSYAAAGTAIALTPATGE